MLSERHELNKIALLELKKDVEETREFSSYFSKMADLLLYVNEIYDTKERTLEQLKQSSFDRIDKSTAHLCI